MEHTILALICGVNAGGALWMNTTPRVCMIASSASGRLPQRRATGDAHVTRGFVVISF